jgi:hypothetical protein
MPSIVMDHPVFICFPSHKHSIIKLLVENSDFREICEDYKTVIYEIATETLPEGNTSQPVLNELLRLKSDLEADIQRWL